MIVVHNICTSCEQDRPHPVFTRVVFDRGSDTCCCFCGRELVTGAYTNTAPDDVVVCNNKHRNEYPT